MLVTLTRGIILYIVITVFMRFMGKRQLGELQPSELVVTILLSEIVSVPMESNGAPFLGPLLASGALVCLEIISSVVNMKFPTISTVIQGKPAVIINNGKLNQKKLKSLRFTAEDVLEQLRQKDIFNISEVEHAVVETNGSLSVKKKPQYETLTAGQFGIKKGQSNIQTLIINDGKLIKRAMKEQNISLSGLESILIKEGVNITDVLILTINDINNYTLIKKEKK